MTIKNPNKKIPVSKAPNVLQKNENPNSEKKMIELKKDPSKPLNHQINPPRPTNHDIIEKFN